MKYILPITVLLMIFLSTYVSADGLQLKFYDADGNPVEVPDWFYSNVQNQTDSVQENISQNDSVLQAEIFVTFYPENNSVNDSTTEITSENLSMSQLSSSTPVHENESLKKISKSSTKHHHTTIKIIDEEQKDISTKIVESVKPIYLTSKKKTNLFTQIINFFSLLFK